LLLFVLLYQSLAKLTIENIRFQQDPQTNGGVKNYNITL